MYLNNNIEQSSKFISRKMLTTDEKLLYIADLISVRVGEKTIDSFDNGNARRNAIYHLYDKLICELKQSDFG